MYFHSRTKQPKKSFSTDISTDISVIKSAECFLEDEYQNWCGNEVLKQLARGVQTCDLNVDINLKNIKPLLAN